MISNNNDRYSDSYSDDTDDYSHINCLCKSCGGGKTREPRRRPGASHEPGRQNRFVVMAHRGFRVSFPDPEYRPEDQDQDRDADEEADEEAAEKKSNAKKLQQLIAQGLWGDERARYYTNLIDDFKYQVEDDSRSAFPRHHALIATAFGSSVSILESAHLWASPIARLRIFAPIWDWDSMKMKSKAFAMAPASSVFTETSHRQRIKLVVYSGLSGILCARLFGNCHTQFGARLQKLAFEIMRRTHSSHTSEMLVDNHYCTTPPKTDCRFDMMMSLKAARAELRILYSECIDELKTKARQYRCGRIDKREIHLDERFEKMHSLMMLCSRRLLTPNNFIDPVDLMKPKHKSGSCEYIARIMKFVTEFSGLYDKDVVRLYGSSIVRFRNTIIVSQIRLASQGCYAALLAFAAFEPRMIDEHIAPEIGGCQNTHIPSRHKTFGKLLQMYRHHIPRTADVLKNVCRHYLY